MRNPIIPTADRPFPLPDRLLMDGWWLIKRAEPVEDGVRGIIAKEEGAIERDRNRGRPPVFAPRT